MFLNYLENIDFREMVDKKFPVFTDNIHSGSIFLGEF